MHVKILSWNIWIDGHFEEIKEVLKNSHADILALQEVQENDPERQVIPYLTSLGYEHVFDSVTETWDGKVWKLGPAIFSTYPILLSNTHVLSEENKRIAVQADIQIENKVLHVFSTHLSHTHQQNSDAQKAQAVELLQHVPNDMSIVMGDFNATPESTTIQEMKKVLRDTDQNDQPTWSVYPEGCKGCNPQKIDTRLDYIFTTKDIQTHSYTVENSKASDHLPISVIVEL